MAPKDATREKEAIINSKDVEWPKYRMPEDQHLGEHNYAVWKASWEAVLESAGIPVTSKTLELDQVTDFTWAWKLKETIKSAYISKVGVLTSGKAIWFSLNNMLGHAGPAKALIALDTLLDLRMKKLDAIDYGSLFNNLIGELAVYGMELPNTLQIVLFIRGVGNNAPEWSARVRQVLRKDVTNISLLGMIHELCDELVIMKKSPTYKGDKSTHNMDGSSNTPERDEDWKKNIECNNCGNKGHLKRECRKEGGGCYDPSNPSGRGGGNRGGRGGRGRGRGRGRGGGGNTNNASTAPPPAGFDHPMGAPAACATQARCGPGAWAHITATLDRRMAELDAADNAEAYANLPSTSDEVAEAPHGEVIGLRAQGNEYRKIPLLGLENPIYGIDQAPAACNEEASPTCNNDETSPICLIAKTYSSCHENMQERWLFDTGSDIHIINNKSWFLGKRCADLDGSAPILTGGGPVYPTMVGLAEVPLKTGDSVHPVRKVQMNYTVLVEKFPINIFSGERLFITGGYMSKIKGKNVVLDSGGNRITELNIPEWGFFMAVDGQKLPTRVGHDNKE